MATAVTIPGETDLLCEGCGYVLTGLPADARCPECGKPTQESSPALREPPPWETAEAGSRGEAFLRTTLAIWLRPTQAFRTLSLQPGGNASLRFAQIHWAASSVLLGAAAWAHFDWFVTLGGKNQFEIFTQLPLLLGCCLGAFVFLILLTRLAAWLTSFEAGYRGLRLPLPVVLRGLHYHAAHYFPVALVAAGTVLGYQLALAQGWAGGASGATYLYVLCGEIVLGAGYLFSTYWTAMRNLMYANR